MFHNTYPTTRGFRRAKLKRLLLGTVKIAFWAFYAILSLAVFVALAWLALALPDM